MKKRKIALSNSKAAWLGRRDTNVVGKPLAYNASAQMRYQKALFALLRPMIEETKKEIIKTFKSKSAKKFFAQDAIELNIASLLSQKINALEAKYESIFTQSLSDVISGMIQDALTSSQHSLHASLKQLSGGLSIDTSTIPKPLKTIIKATIKENVELIKTIPQHYFKQVQGAVMRSITTEAGLDFLIPELDKYGAMNLRHTRNMALDQTRKAFNNINKQRMIASGIKKFKWLHSGGSKEPRKDHIEMNGKIYSFDDPPVIDKKTGEKGIPGQAINCKCTMNPIIEFEDGEQI